MDSNSEQFQVLLAEALRAGPGSPSWREAVDALKSAGAQGEDYALLCQAREALASGRDYRSIHAGPGFTRKLMSQLDQEKGRAWNIPTASVVAYTAVALMLIGLLIGAWVLFSPSVRSMSAAQLSETYFLDTIASEDFRSGVSSNSTRFGELSLQFDNGMRIEPAIFGASQFLGGGTYFSSPLSPAHAYAAEAAIEISPEDRDVIAQLFVTDRPDFSSDTGITSRELVCLIEQQQVRVLLPDGKTAGQNAIETTEDKAATLRIRIAQEVAVVEQNGNTIWAGAHQLSPDRQRYVGVRLLKRGAGKDSAVVRYLKLSRP